MTSVYIAIFRFYFINHLGDRPTVFILQFSVILSILSDNPTGELTLVILFISDDHPGDAQYLKMLHEERALSKSSRSRHPVPCI